MLRRFSHLRLPTLLASFAVAAIAATPAAADPRIPHLEWKIIGIAESNIDLVEDTATTQAQLEPLIDELLALVPPTTEAEMAPRVQGSWRGLWSNLPYGPDVDTRRVYQVVLDGYYYNVSRVRLPQGGSQTSWLRGTYQDAGDTLTVAFTSDVTTPGWLSVGTRLVDEAGLVESGQVEVTPRNNPGVGATGTLDNVYVSDRLRIVKGKTDGQERALIFVLRRADVVQPVLTP